MTQSIFAWLSSAVVCTRAAWWRRICREWARSPARAGHSALFRFVHVRNTALRSCAVFACSDPVFGLAIAQLLTSVCAILLTLHVVNFSHLDGLVLMSLRLRIR